VRTRSNWNQLNYILLAEASLIITSLLVYQSTSELNFPSQIRVSKVLFASVCALGIIAGIAPKWFSFASRSEKHSGEMVAGHHPDCGYFPGHIVLLGDLWLNFWFVQGAWFMFEAIQVMGLSFLITAYFLSATIFWIYARIRISQWIHVGVCNKCDETCSIRFE
jgi:hypothetical protein